MKNLDEVEAIEREKERLLNEDAGDDMKGLDPDHPRYEDVAFVNIFKSA